MTTPLPESPLRNVLARPGETLTHHTMEVVSRVDAFARLRPLPEYPRLFERLRLAAWLHDAGKLANGFQHGLRSRKHRWGLRHEALSLGFVHWLDTPVDDLLWIIAAIATHHRDASFILDTYRATSGRAEQLINELDPTLTQAWYDWLAGQRVPLRPYTMPTSAAILETLDLLEGLIQPLEQQTIHHPQFADAVLLRGFMLQADHAGAAGVTSQGGVRLPLPAIQERLGEPFPHQTACRRRAGESLILIAPSGSGKTESALLWAAEAAAPRLFYTLPYRASMNAMQQRLSQFAPSVGLQHGTALESLYRQLLTDGHSREDAEAQARARLNLARLYACPIRVFSPYHLVRAAYRLKGWEAALADAQDALIVVDEIHCYQPEWMALILSTLRLLKDVFNARLLIMTATLPPLIHNALNAALGELPVIRADEATMTDFRRHRLHLRHGDISQSFGDIQAEYAAGKAVLVAVNTVRRAREIASQLTQLGCPTLTLHGRFNRRDRWMHEQAVLRHFQAKTGGGMGRPILVSTQVIEVSLDVDFDVIHTDPAPLDALIQRFGRVNRTRRLPDLAPVYVYTQPTGEDERRSIYSPALVRASLAVLMQHDGEAVEEAQVGDWLSQAYNDAVWWQPLYDERRAAFEQWVLGSATPFESADRGLLRQFDSLFDGCNILPVSLEDAYRALLKTQPLEADSLLVPLSWGQFKMLEGDGQAWRGEGADEGLLFADMPYSPALGLQLHNDEEE